MSLRQTPLHRVHEERDARFTDFGGWEMPVEFTSIRDEHTAVREKIGIFDVSHMGQIEITGNDAMPLCQRLTTGDVSAIEPGEAQYTTVPREDGTILDDTILYRLTRDRYLLVPNAGQDERITSRWIEYRNERGDDAEIANATADWGMLAIQGPDVAARLPVDFADLAPMTITEVTIAGVSCWCATTGYTGEPGVELLVPWEETETVDATIDGTRCGLGARDTLRLEMGFVLAGNEFDQNENRRTPYEARLGFAVALDTDPPCLGCDALRTQQQNGPDQLLAGLRMEERGIPRHGYDITDGDGLTIGAVTSGTMSPTLGEPIGLGYVDASYADPGSTVAVSMRGTERRASIVTLPFLESAR